MNVEWFILGLYAFGLLFSALFLFGLRRLFHASWFWPFHFLKSVLLAAVATLSLLLANQFSLFFEVLPSDSIVDLSITRMNDQQFHVQLHHATHSDLFNNAIDQPQMPENYMLRGDQWQLEIRILSWHPLLSALGFPPLYKFERLAGRYHSIQQELHSPRTLYQLEDSTELHRYFQRLLTLLHGSLIQSYQGASVYAPLAHSARYSVFMTASGMVVKPLNQAAMKALSAW
jgi:hypothetical protein